MAGHVGAPLRLLTLYTRVGSASPAPRDKGILVKEPIYLLPSIRVRLLLGSYLLKKRIATQPRVFPHIWGGGWPSATGTCWGGWKVHLASQRTRRDQPASRVPLPTAGCWNHSHALYSDPTCRLPAGVHGHGDLLGGLAPGRRPEE